MENRCICCDIIIPLDTTLCNKCKKNSENCVQLCEVIKAFHEGRLIIIPETNTKVKENII